MKRLLCMLLFANIAAKTLAQSSRKSLDFIVVIDDTIASGTISLPKIVFIFNGKEGVIRVSYYPGSLSMDSNEYAKLLSDSTKSIYLVFDQRVSAGSLMRYDHYEIELKKPWLEDYYNIIRIFNLRDSKYMGKYESVGKGKEYNYELESPSHSYKLIQKLIK